MKCVTCEIVVVKNCLIFLLSKIFIFFGFIIGTYYINYRYLGNSYILQMFLLIIIVLSILRISNTPRVFDRKEHAIEYLNTLTFSNLNYRNGSKRYG